MKTRLVTQWWCLLVAGVLLGGCGKGEEGPGLPGAPSDVEAQAADAQALVTWTPPTSDGGHPLLYYVVRCDPACGGAIVSASERQATVLGLNNGFKYLFKVSGVNARGEGDASLPSVPVVPQPGMSIPNPTTPGQPRSVRATPGNGAVFVSWLAPASFGGRALKHYLVTAEPGGHSVTVDVKAGSANVPGLPNGKPHTVTVRAVNDVGEGPGAQVGPVTPKPGGAPASWVSGYYVGYQHRAYPPDVVDFSGMTHIMVGRVRPRFDGTLFTDFDVSDLEGPAIARTLSARAKAAGKIPLLMIGGFGEHDGFVLASTGESRIVFVRELLKTMDELGYMGLDLDWEPINLPPAGNDGELLLALIDELRAARPDIILTVPVNWLNSNFGMPEHEAKFMKELGSRVDQLNIMSYKMSGHWGGWESWHSSPLWDEAQNRPSSVANSVAGYIRAGVPRGRLGVGIGFFGTCWQGVTQPRIPLDGRPDVNEGQSDNAMSYANIVDKYLQDPLMKRHWDERAASPYLSASDVTGAGHCNYVSYEDGQSVAVKGQWARDEGLGGTIIWTINQGHRPLQPAGKKDELLLEVKRAFLDP
ncbi:glycosyl hydrolase family 18 protein [Myxococcus sp. MISCRS1]|uniref:glycosyl hydrolase family 18 protein n=1 Tax=Myxococcus sp. MISCRS1 TaxID=2996786 RepID=UPI00226D919E|nr:glycosyl hydrolase family 18 protein [Myxococcus sp. MISCRS1]MCY0996861.1 glycosyl hydrolase family 18 protein [Myxococcus sp. MISCRS1]BDT33127.1 glycosyl hydrolase family 18 protein [Myxococcus sp. MH1]